MNGPFFTPSVFSPQIISPVSSFAPNYLTTFVPTPTYNPFDNTSYGNTAYLGKTLRIPVPGETTEQNIMKNRKKYQLIINNKPLFFNATPNEYQEIINHINNLMKTTKCDGVTDTNYYQDLEINNLYNNINNSNNIYKISRNPLSNQHELEYYLNGNLYKTYSGAGIMIFENDFMNLYNSRRGPVVLLFRSAHTGRFEELGGSIDSKDFAHEKTLPNTAIREAYEESSLLFKFSDNNIFSMQNVLFPYVNTDNISKPIISKQRIYVCYGICIDSLSQPQSQIYWKINFLSNRDILMYNRAHHTLLEMDDMTRFYVQDLIPHLNNPSHFTAFNTDGVPCVISDRTRKVLKSMMKPQNLSKPSIYNYCIQNPKKIKYKENNNLHNGIVTYVI